MLAFLFPGQGSQTVGMGKALVDQFSVARAAFEQAAILSCSVAAHSAASPRTR